MIKLCLQCNQTYDYDFTGVNCPRTSCSGKVMPISNQLVPIIKLLHEKGYYTEVAEIGCITDEETVIRIRFNSCVNRLSSMPQNFKKSFVHDDKLMIYRSIKVNDLYAKQAKVNECMLFLIEWAQDIDPVTSNSIDGEAKELSESMKKFVGEKPKKERKSEKLTIADIIIPLSYGYSDLYDEFDDEFEDEDEE